MRTALNHMTVPAPDWRALLDLAADLGCDGVELAAEAVGGGSDATTAIRDAARERGLTIHAVGGLAGFNDWTEARAAQAEALIAAAAACGAEAVTLVPRNDGRGGGNGERQANLRVALRELAPRLARHGLTGLVAPLGHQSCALRRKSELVETIEALGLRGRIRLVHDTFHHRLAGETAVFAAHTGIVHVSGVSDPAPATREMTEAHRGLVDAADRLGSVAQIEALRAAGYDGPVSMAAPVARTAAPADPGPALAASFAFIRARMAAHAA